MDARPVCVMPLAIPTLSGTIARRLLVNFRADPGVVQALLPAPFRPQLHNGHAIIGVCLIRLERVRPAGMPPALGLSSENAAHRFAVSWDDEHGEPQNGVYIPRRDTDSRLSALCGGRLFPGQQHLAHFDVAFNEEASELDFSMRSRDESIAVRLRGAVSDKWPASSCFADVGEASAFFQGGARGFSPRTRSSGVDGMQLRTDVWRVEPFEANDVHSRFFEDESKFPRAGVHYDHTLLMRDIAHQWNAVPQPRFSTSA